MEQQDRYISFDWAVKIQNDVLDGAKLEGQMQGQIEGRIQGRMEGMSEVAYKFKNMGMPTEVIMQSTGLSEEDINKLS